ncbi:MAG: 1-phosphofructokinase family hexose kinase [Sphingomonadales bacterium]|nr:1-phosphofructokinase family hexose kinase [Sphingomonadales bacterium]MBD3774491.1 1-phosphofructokinase family hexose kinase [Paracoccaceae bacterium]
MMNIATLTMNPTIDVAYEVETLRHTHKMRCDTERADPGGGGINVARVFVRLGGNATCYYLSGGATGAALDGLLDLHLLVRRPVRIEGHTRVATNVFETSSGKEYRFVPEGPRVGEGEWQACLDMVAQAQCDYLVASGSLPPGVPDDFYARLVPIAQSRGIRLVLDTSGPAMAAGLAAGGVHLVKPSAGELRQLAGRELAGPDEVGAAALELVDQGRAELVAVTMGHEGGILASAAGAQFVPALPVEAKSAVGAGDSFLAGMVWALARGWEAFDAFRFGMAAGSAAVLTPGTDLCRPADVERLYRDMPR